MFIIIPKITSSGQKDTSTSKDLSLGHKSVVITKVTWKLPMNQNRSIVLGKLLTLKF